MAQWLQSPKSATGSCYMPRSWMDLPPSWSEAWSLTINLPVEDVGPVIKFVLCLMLLEAKKLQRWVLACRYPCGELGIPVSGTDANSWARFSIAQH